MVSRVFVEKKEQFDSAKKKLIADINNLLGVFPKSVKKFIRYDVEGLTDEEMANASVSIFSEPTVDNLYHDNIDIGDAKVLVSQYLDGQYDQRADSAMQCVQLLTGGVKPLVRCANVYLFEGITDDDLEKIKKYIINPVDSKQGDMSLPTTLKRDAVNQGKMRVELDNFIDYNIDELEQFYNSFGFAMTFKDLQFVQGYFQNEKRNPTLTEIKVIDTYWSDHCRHTTFLTEIKNVKILSTNPHIKEAFNKYQEVFKELYAARPNKYVCLMDIATIVVKVLKKEGYLDNLDQSDEINACSVNVKVDVNGVDEDYLIMFKNETHNHPTEIEPFGGAATCLGGAIRDPLSGRTYVYQAMRVTGAGDPTEDYSKTMKGKLPQRVLTKTALNGFSSYGNQIGLATGIVAEVYNDRYKAKRLETGYVIGANKKENVIRTTPQPNDVVILVGGDTGRDGCGGATGSSKAHTTQSVDVCGAEVQKGNAPEERKLQRLFRNEKASKLIGRCNDFGAGGVCVAIGELSDGLDIYLDRVNKKYEGLSATELAISESQERMAVVVKPQDADEFIRLANEENLKAVKVAVVTDTEHLRMFYGDETIVDISREFLNTNGVKQITDAVIEDNYDDFFDNSVTDIEKDIKTHGMKTALSNVLNDLNVCSQKGLGEVFDSTIGGQTVLMPFGGKTQLTPAMIMASKPPVDGFTHTVTCSSYAVYPELMIHSPFIGAIYSIVGSVSKMVASGVKYDTIRLTLQEFFKRLNDVPQRWGEPLSALLGAFDAEINMHLGAIGGKDSMSGTFEDIDVPPTVISFACGVTKDDNIIHNVFPNSGYVYHYPVAKDEFGRPDYEKLLQMYAEIEENIANKVITHANIVEKGGRIVSLVKALFGNMNGANLDSLTSDDFISSYGDILVVTNTELKSDFALHFATLNDSGNITFGKNSISLSEILPSFVSKLENVFPTTATASGDIITSNYKTDKIFAPNVISGKPRIFIPVFPGTNCEYDMARAFTCQGGEADIFVIKNVDSASLKESIQEMKKRIAKAQIIAFPGGFSGGDEPDGSGKFIATTFKNPILKEEVENLLYKRDGLAIGICNGFQALIKLGLLPYGKIENQTPDSPTLTYNNISRHVSTISRVRVGTNKSPWLSEVKVGDIYSVPVSHGEGKFICNSEHFDRLLNNGQIFTQYVDDDDHVTMTSPFNPNGSMYGVEGIISPDGRVIGKMGHTERFSQGLYQNIEGNFDMPLFKAGIKYFK